MRAFYPSAAARPCTLWPALPGRARGPAQAADQGGADAQESFGEHPDVCAPPDHQCRHRRPELEGVDDQVQRSGLPEL